MSQFTLHDIDSAPEESRPLLAESQKAFGMVPNLHAVMAESPQNLEAYQKLHELFEATSLSTEEKNVVWLTISVENACHYCVPAHTGIARMQNVSEDIIQALRDDKPLADSKLEALRQFTRSVLRNQGHVPEIELNVVMEAGYNQRQILDVLVGVAQKTLSNYVNHIAQTPLDQTFQDDVWARN